MLDRLVPAKLEGLTRTVEVKAGGWLWTEALPSSDWSDRQAVEEAEMDQDADGEDPRIDLVKARVGADVFLAL